MKKRSYEPELLDLGSVYYTKEEYEGCLSQLARIGQYLGGDKATLKTFHRIVSPSTILDVGCGGGFFAIQLAKCYPHACILGLDVSDDAIQFAQKQSAKANVENVKFEVSQPSLDFLPAKSFDVVTSTLVCHHLNDKELIDFLKNAYRIASKSVIINDLHRHWLACAGFWLIARPLFRNRLIFHDGLISIKRGFTKEEWMHYLVAAEIPLERCTLTWHWAFRWVLSIDAYK